MTVVAIGLSVARAMRQIGAHPRVLSVKPRPDLSSEMFVADVEMDAGLPSRWRADGQSPNGVRSVEVVTAIFLRDFPATAPRFFLRKDFDRSHPHLQPVTLSRFRLANQRVGFLRFAACADSQGVWHGGKVSGYGER